MAGISINPQSVPAALAVCPFLPQLVGVIQMLGMTTTALGKMTASGKNSLGGWL